MNIGDDLQYIWHNGGVTGAVVGLIAVAAGLLIGLGITWAVGA